MHSNSFSGRGALLTLSISSRGGSEVLEYFFSLLIPIVIIGYLLHRHTTRHFRQIDERIGRTLGELHILRDQLALLESQIRGLGNAVGHPIIVPEETSEHPTAATEQAQQAVVIPQQEDSAAPLKSAEHVTFMPETMVSQRKPVDKPPAIKQPPTRQTTHPKPRVIDDLIKRFLENWTGILGTIVLVAGIGFVGTYAALRLPAFGRFALVVAASIALFSGHLVLRNKKRWQDMALWLRSSSAAVFLFACAAAGSLPNVGIMWIENKDYALVVLLIGMALNLILSWSVGRQGFASLHVVLALIPMAILPQVSMTLGIATVVSVFGVVLAYRHRWHLHLITTVLAYGAFHIFWIIEQETSLPLPANLAALAVTSATLIFLGGAMVAYRGNCSTRLLKLQKISAHLICWGYLATSLFIHLRGIRSFSGMLLGAALLITALIAFGLSVFAQRRKVAWLHTADALIAQGFALAALASWHWQLEFPLSFHIVVYLETLLFLRLTIMDTGNLTARIGGLIVLGSATMFLGAASTAQSELKTAIEAWQHAGVLFAGALITILSGVYFLRKFSQRFVELTLNLGGIQPLVIIGPLSGLMVIVALNALKTQEMIGATAMAAGASLLYAAHRQPGLGLAYGTWMVLVASNFFVWTLSYQLYAGSTTHQLIQLIPVSVLMILAIWRTPYEQWQDGMRQMAIYLLGIHIGLSVFFLLSPTSTLLPTVVWLMLSLISLEIASHRARLVTALPVLHLGYFYVIVAAISYMLVIMPTLIYLGRLNLRLAIELYGVVVLLYWWLARPIGPLASSSHWQRIQPYFLELTLLLTVSTVLLEVPMIWRPLAWMAFGFLFLAPPITSHCSRIAFYSLAAFITSVLALTANVSIAAVPSPHWYHQPWSIGLVAVIIQLFYLFVAYHRLKLEYVRFQPELSRLDHLSGYLSENLAATICYPFFFGLAIFLAWRFEQAILTFLWASETFAIFVLSIVLRQNHFRLISLAGLAACLFRLLVYDMHATEIFIRGLVFIGVGLLMLAMNAVYNKYGTRMEKR